MNELGSQCHRLYRVEKSEKIEGCTNAFHCICLKKNADYHQPYSLSQTEAPKM